MFIRTQSNPYDLTIIGAGIIGMMTAFQISKIKPDWQILLIDKSLVGHGTTQYSLGMNYNYGSTPLRRELTEESSPFWNELQKELGNNIIQPHPFYGIFSHKEKEKYLNRIIDSSIHTLNETDEQLFFKNYPWLQKEKEEQIIHGNDITHANALAVVQKLAHKIKDSNVSIIEGIDVTSLRSQKNVNKISTSTNEKIYSKKILLAVGPWILTSPWKEIANKLDIRIKKIVSFHFAKESKQNDPLIFFMDKDAFLLPDTESKQWNFSFTVQTWDLKPDINQLYITKEDQSQGFAILESYCPSLLPSYRGGRVFCDAYSPELSPIIEKIEGYHQVYIAGCGSGSGFRFAPAIAKRAIKLLVD